MPEWKVYQRKGSAEMRPHVVGEDMSGISVSDLDVKLLTKPGGMIARDPSNPADQWYVNKSYFEKNFEEVRGLHIFKNEEKK